jgi:hypothetical protein
MGILEIRGTGKRVVHYKGYINNKRIYEKHTILSAKGLNNKILGSWSPTELDYNRTL